MDGICQDVVLAVRYLRKHPGFTIPVVLTLALGIAANGTIFTLADAVLVRPLDVADSDRIVHVYQTRRGQPPQPYSISFADYLDYRSARSFESLAAHYPTSPIHAVVQGEGGSTTSGAVVTANYFDLLQLKPALGRFFSAEEDRVRGRDALAVIGYGFWQRRLGGDPRAIGSAITLNGTAFTIVGVAPEGFAGVLPRRSQTEIWIPSAMFAVGYRYCDAFARDCSIVALLGKLRRDSSRDAAQRELDVLASGLAATYPATHKDLGVQIIEARGLGYGSRPEETRQMSLFLSVVGIVLLIACANIAGLLLARATQRRKEIAMRLALGASRWRILRQLLTESFVIAAAGGALGVLMALWGVELLQRLYAFDEAGRTVNFQLTMRVPVFVATGLVAFLSAVLFGLAPALQASRTDTATILKSTTGSGDRGRLRQALVTAQVALSVMLLVAAGLLLQSAARVSRGAGFDPKQVVTLRLRPSLVDYPRERAVAYQRDVLRALESLPGVVSASPTVYLTMIGAGVLVPVAEPAAAQTTVDVTLGHAGARYFETLSIPLRDGREFSDRDDLQSPRVTIVNELLANRLWPSRRAVGQSLVIQGRQHTVVGVVGDAQYYASGEAATPKAFVSYWQPASDDAFLKDSRLMIRVAGDPAASLPTIRRAIIAVDLNVPVSEDHPLASRMRHVYQPVTLARAMVASFAGLALFLSAVGLYGVLAFSVAQRTSEIAIRVSIGADRSRVMGLILGNGLRLAAMGIALGVAGAWVASRMLATLLYGVETHDAVSFVVAPTLVLIVATLAALLPAIRAANVAPSIALRYE
jgi:predicted permease